MDRFILGILLLLLLVNLGVSIASLAKFKNKETPDTHENFFKKISKMGNSTNKFLGTFRQNDNRDNYIIFKDNNTMISNLWGVQKYISYDNYSNEVIIGSDPENGKVDFLKANISFNQLVVTSIDEGGNETGLYKGFFSRSPN